MRAVRILILGLLSALSLPAAAAQPTYWLNIKPDIYFLSQEDACRSVLGELQAMYPDHRIFDVQGVNGATGECSYRYNPDRNFFQAYLYNGSAIRVRSKTCESGGTDTISWPIGREEVDGGDASFVSFENVIPDFYCISGCKALPDPDAEDDSFWSRPDSNPLYEIIYADYTYKFNGDACATSSNPAEPDIPPPPEPDLCTINPNDPACDDGEPGGGDTGGGDTGGGDTGGGDTGGGDTGGGDTGGGDTGGGDTGGGDTGGGDTGGGDTGGGDGGNGSSVSGEDCSAALTCQGDAIQCAILRAAKAARCAEQFEFGPKEKGEVEELLSGEDYQIPDKDIDMSELFEEGTSAARWLPASCPQPRSIVILGRSYEYSWQPLCDFASALSPIIVALASLFFIIHVGRGIKE